jgi:hypothetical protein
VRFCERVNTTELRLARGCLVVETDATLFVVDDDSPLNKSLKNLIRSLVANHEKNDVNCGWLEPAL